MVQIKFEFNMNHILTYKCVYDTSTMYLFQIWKYTCISQNFNTSSENGVCHTPVGGSLQFDFHVGQPLNTISLNWEQGRMFLMHVEVKHFCLS